MLQKIVYIKKYNNRCKELIQNKSNSMCDFVCSICDKPFKRKANLIYHESRKVCVEKPYKCKFCPSKFTSKAALYTHVREVCKGKKKEDNKKNGFNKRLLKLEEDNKKLKKDNENLKKQIKSSKTKNINNGNVVNADSVDSVINADSVVNVNNIALIGYGHEDMEKLDKKDILKAIQNGFKSVVNLTEAMHFNPKHPEYHNIYISNLKNKYAMMYNGNKWDVSMKDELIDRIYDDKKNYIEENLDEFVGLLSVSRKNALDRWLNTDEEDSKISKIKNDIKLLLYNKRNVIKDVNDNKQNIIVKKEKPKIKTKTKRTIKDGQ